ncbi:uncharacterized protein LOC125796834 [Astyanax mexicanus]|uniref:uncharacterized protein LOC125796834 n=1 Tax=Astyanax mexicanus TaxID=7994 RepID=UPI0020CB6727|nr:uncharacterized protein LOC125796834 [Astyanax mexicanus]
MTLLDLRDKFEGSDSPYLFLSKTGGRCKNILDYFQDQWVELGFEGKYTFRNLRTSMVHYTKDLTPRKRAPVHRSMCHSEAVASKFYIPLNTAQEAAVVRGLQEGESDEPGPSPKKAHETKRTSEAEEEAGPSPKKAKIDQETSDSEEELQFSPEDEDDEEDDGDDDGRLRGKQAIRARKNLQTLFDCEAEEDQEISLSSTGSSELETFLEKN